jgi:phosphoribosylglycinamide formyltransferase-1
VASGKAKIKGGTKVATGDADETAAPLIWP